MSGNDSAKVGVVGRVKRDPTDMVVTRETGPPSQAVSPTGLHTDGKTDGIIDLQIPNLLPTDNVSVEREVQVMRTKIPVRITNINVEVIDNGYVVHLPQAGRQHEYHGPDGARHAFSDKAAMLEFIGQVVGQVTYQYNETEMHEAKTKPTIIGLEEMIDALEDGQDVAFEGYEATAMKVQ